LVGSTTASATRAVRTLVGMTIWVSAATLSGCSTIYVHNADAEKSTSTARAALDDAKIEEVFERQGAYLSQLQSEELRTVIARDGAERDTQLALFLTGNGEEDGLGLLAENARNMSVALYRGSGGPDPDQDPLHPLWRRLEIGSREQLWDTTILANYERVVANYQKSGGRKPTDCEMAQLAQVDAGDSAEQGDRYLEVLKACQQLAQMRALELTGEAAGFSQPLSAEIAAAAFNYQQAKDALAGLEASLEMKKSVAQHLGAQLEGAEKQLETAFAAGTTSRSQLDHVVQELHDKLSLTEKTAGNPYVRKVISEKLSEALKDIVDATTPLDRGCSSANATTGSGSGCPGPSVARASLAVFQAAASVGDAFSNPPRVPHPNVLAVANAQMNYSRDVASAEIARLQAEIESARRKLQAFTTELYMLSRAREELRGVSTFPAKNKGVADILANPKTPSEQARHIKAALYFYVQAWNTGRTVADEIAVEQRIALRRAAMESSRRAVQEWVDTIEPGLDTLVQYGAGGFDPKSIAQILGNLGLVATGVGVNR
jgi:hypothetical protein